MRQGFTLIQISILLIVASLVLVNVLPSTRTALTDRQQRYDREDELRSDRPARI
jgi:competence protein ComGC